MKKHKVMTISLFVIFLILTALNFQSYAASITLRVLSTTIVEKPEGNVERQIAEEFMQKNPDIKIEFIGVPMNNVYAKITTLATGGDMPDIFTNVPQFVAQAADLGIVEDLDELLGPDFIKGFYPNAIREASLNGKLQFIPWFSTPLALLYRGDWFKAEGLAAPQTWDDFVAVAKKLTKDVNNDGKVDRWGFAMLGARNDSAMSRYNCILKTFGAYELRRDTSGNWVTDVDSPKGINALRFFTDLYLKDHVVPPGPTEVSYAEALELMALEKTGMMITGPHSIGGILARNPKLAGKIYSVPVPKKEKHVSFLGVYGFSISKTSKHKDAAVKYLKYLISKENLLEWNRVTGRMPCRIDAGKEPQISGPVYAGFVKAMDYAEAVPNVAFYPEIIDIEGEAVQAVLTGQATPEQAAKKAGEKIRAAIRRAQ